MLTFAEADLLKLKQLKQLKIKAETATACAKMINKQAEASRTQAKVRRTIKGQNKLNSIKRQKFRKMLLPSKTIAKS